MEAPVVEPVERSTNKAKENRRRAALANIAKGQRVNSAKRDAEKTYGKENVAKVEWAEIPQPPPGLFPDSPIFTTVWNLIVKSAQKDLDAAQWLASVPKLREQAEAESALKQRESSLLPAYLQEAPPIIGVALERQDSTLATILHRMDNGLPLSTMEALIGKWINGRRSGSDRTAGAEADAIAEALELADGETDEAGEAGDQDGGEAISGGLPEPTARGEGSEEREGGAFLGPICAETGPLLEKPESQEKIPEPELIYDILPPILKTDRVQKAPIRTPKRRKK